MILRLFDRRSCIYHFFRFFYENNFSDHSYRFVNNRDIFNVSEKLKTKLKRIFTILAVSSIFFSRMLAFLLIPLHRRFNIKTT